MKQRQYNPKHSFSTKLRKGDQVLVLAGRARGETAKIESIDTKRGRVYLSGGTLIAKKHQKPDPQNEGGIVEVPVSIDISNVAMVDPKTKKPTRVGFRVDDGRRVRVARKSGATLD